MQMWQDAWYQPHMCEIHKNIEYEIGTLQIIRIGVECAGQTNSFYFP